MRKMLIVLLCVILLFSHTGSFANEPEAVEYEANTEMSAATQDLNGLVNIAMNKPAVADSCLVNTAAQGALDGDSSTYWMSGNSGGYPHRLIVDLGTLYSLNVIGYLPPPSVNAASNFQIYGSNDPSFQEKSLFYSQTSPLSSAEIIYITIPAQFEAEMFRYIAIEKAGGLGELGVAELEVYIPESSAIPGTDIGPIMLVSQNQQTYASNDNNNINNLASSGVGALINDGNPDTLFSASAGVHRIHCFIDLGEAYTIPYVALQTKTSAGTADYILDYAANFFIVGTNDPQLKAENYNILAQQMGVIPLDSSNRSGLILYETADEYKDQKYRYVGVVKTTDYLLRNINRLSVSQLDVYTQAENVDFLTRNLKAVKKENSLNVSAGILSNQLKQLSMLFGLYDANNNVLKSSSEFLTGTRYGITNINSVVDLGDGKASILRVTFLDNLQNRKLLAVLDFDLLALTGNEFKNITRWGLTYPTEGANTVTVSKSANTIEITGKAASSAVGIIALKPGYGFNDNASDGIYCTEIQKTGANGAFHFSVTMGDNDPIGTYQMKLFSDNLTNDISNETYLFTIVSQTELIADFNNVNADTFMSVVEKYSEFFNEYMPTLHKKSDTIGSAYLLAVQGLKEGLFHQVYTDINTPTAVITAIKAALLIDITRNEQNDDTSPYIDAMPLLFGETYDQEEFEMLVKETKKVFSLTNAENIVKAYRRALALSLILNGTYAERETAIRENAHDLGIESSTLNDSGVSLLQIAKNLDSSESAVRSYVAGMDGVIKNIIKELTSVKNSPNGGSISLGTSGKALSGAKTILPQPELSQVQQPIDNTSSESITLKFTDLDNYSWAHEEISKLTDRNIISGRGEGIFDPDSSVTREEVVKMLVLVCNFATDQVDNGYNDCYLGDWYYPYITAAKDNGIITGKTRYEFGRGDHVTRQELAAMLFRAMQKKGIIISEESETFTDEEQIADYAKQAVSALAAQKIILGFEDNHFAPNQVTTRVQAAVVLGRLISLIEAKGEAQ